MTDRSERKIQADAWKIVGPSLTSDVEHLSDIDLERVFYTIMREALEVHADCMMAALEKTPDPTTIDMRATMIGTAMIRAMVNAFTQPPYPISGGNIRTGLHGMIEGFSEKINAGA